VAHDGMGASPPDRLYTDPYPELMCVYPLARGAPSGFRDLSSDIRPPASHARRFDSRSVDSIWKERLHVSGF
jgi:hypothetical protein